MGYSAGYLAGPAGLVGYSAGSTNELLWRDTWRDPLASYSGMLSMIFGGIRCQAAPVGYLAGSTDELLLGGSIGELLWWDTRRDPWHKIRRNPLASYSRILSRILGGIRCHAALVGYLAGSTDELRRDALAGSGGSAGCSAGSAARLLWWDWRDPLPWRATLG